LREIFLFPPSPLGVVGIDVGELVAMQGLGD
jgi:hypothetical protein